MSIDKLSGPGVDRRAFDFFNLSGYDVHHIESIKPKKNETIQHDARRLLEQSQHKQPMILAGVSFAGMIAIEMRSHAETGCVVWM